jgi:hypothetical protein
MPHPIRIWSNAYAPTPSTDPFSLQVEKPLWTTAMRQESGRRKFLRIEHPYGFDDWIAPIGEPVASSGDAEEKHDEDCYNVFLPLWMIDTARLEGGGQEAVAEIVNEDYFPEATRIVLRVIDSAFYNADVKAELERALSAMGVIRQHTTLQIPIQALDGYTVEVFISQTEPANIVLCDGEEVAVEFEEPVDQIQTPRPPTPMPEPPSVLLPGTMIPDEPVETTGFRPFQGQGRTLGGSNVAIPEWRRDLGPPRRS